MTYAEHAHAYLALGYSPLPLPAGQKFPPPEGWTGKHAPMASGADVQAWIEEQPDANIGLRLPAGVIAIDVDNHKHDALTTMQNAVAALGDLPRVPKSTARAPQDVVSGHRLFRVPADLVFARDFDALGYGPGIDIIQRHHRYIVAPPSVHPDTGTPYRYLRGDEEVDFPSVDELPELPARWVEALKPHAREVRTSDEHAAYDALDARGRGSADRWVARTVAAIYAELEDMKTWPEGQTDDKGGWEEGILSRTARLAGIVLADWNALTAEDVLAELPERLPVGGKCTVTNGMSKFVRGLENVAPSPLPSGLEDHGDWFDDTIARVRHEGPTAAAPVEETAAAAESDDEHDLWPARDWSPTGNVLRTAQFVDGDLICNLEGADRIWHEFDGKIWTRGGANQKEDLPLRWVHRALKAAIPLEAGNYDDKPALSKDGVPKPGSSERDRFITWMQDNNATGRNAGVATMMRTNAADYGFHRDVVFDASPYDFGAANGIVDLRTGEVRPYGRDEFLTISTPFEYDPEATAPRFEKYLESSLPDADVREYLQRVMGYSMIGINPEAAMFIHYGPKTANGKSVLTFLMEKILGGYFAAASSKSLLVSRNEKSGQDIADLAGPRFLALSETSEGARIDEEQVKAITGGDLKGERELYQGRKGSGFRVTGKIHISTNHLPHISADEAIARRIHLITWPMSFVSNPQIGLREAIVDEEAEGVLAWLVEGAKRWHQEVTATGKTGLDRPLTLQLQLSEYLEDEDEVQRWLRERTVAKADGTTLHSELYDDYRSWSGRQSSGQPMSSATFGKRLTRYGYESKKSNGVSRRAIQVTGVVATPFWG